MDITTPHSASDDRVVLVRTTDPEEADRIRQALGTVSIPFEGVFVAPECPPDTDPDDAAGVAHTSLAFLVSRDRTEEAFAAIAPLHLVHLLAPQLSEAPYEAPTRLARPPVFVWLGALFTLPLVGLRGLFATQRRNRRGA